ncbi:hypothetical protein K438DRAFT_1909270 [Mycena galopus ATCC 62051]|nr:hypothetical protein K438DRAFT_1909270 [Mycena galopus ATCC 62051]
MAAAPATALPPTAAAPVPSSTATFSFKAPLPPSTSTSRSAPLQDARNGQEGAAQTLKQRRVSLALPSSPRLVPEWHFRDDTSVPYADAGRKGKVRRIDTSLADEDDADGAEEGDASSSATPEKERGAEREKKPRRKWTPEETQMLVDGCKVHGVGNWKAILSDPTLSFQGRSPVDLKDRFRTYFPEAYRTHYPNARTHLPPSLTRAASPSAHPIAASSSSSPSHPHARPLSTASTGSTSGPSTSTSIPTKPNRSTHPDGTPLFPLPSPAHPKRRPFSAEEDAALLAGFRKHGAAWAAIAKEGAVFAETGRRSEATGGGTEGSQREGDGQ